MPTYPHLGKLAFATMRIEMIKKILLLSACFILLCSCNQHSVSHDFEVDGIYYKIVDEDSRLAMVTYKGRDWNAYDHEYRDTILIPNTVTYRNKVYRITEIGDYAFAFCDSLASVTIGNGVTLIDNSAFYGCSDLETLYISNTIENIDDYAFAECNNILDIKIGSKKSITASENIFSNDVYNNACLYVPEGRKFAYEKTSPWENFYIQEINYTGIEDINAENGNVKAIYDLQGRRVENPTEGIYIVNGKKIFIK